MSSEELWEAYETRNPSFGEPGNVTMSSTGLKKLFSQTWSIAHDSGYRQGLRDGQRKRSLDGTNEGPKNPFDDIFGAFRTAPR